VADSLQLGEKRGDFTTLRLRSGQAEYTESTEEKGKDRRDVFWSMLPGSVRILGEISERLEDRRL